MSDRYEGPRFKTIFIEKDKVKHEKAEELIRWCKTFANMGLAPECGGGFAGNLSFRAKEGFIITGAGANLKDAGESDLAHVIRQDPEKKIVYAKGQRDPSSEALLHSKIYSLRKEINAVFHGHDNAVLANAERLNLPITKEEQPYGSTGLIREVTKALGTYNYIIIKNHGFLALGSSIEKAGDLALEKHEQALRLSGI